jgi:hypothetical protein
MARPIIPRKDPGDSGACSGRYHVSRFVLKRALLNVEQSSTGRDRSCIASIELVKYSDTDECVEGGTLDVIITGVVSYCCHH